MSVNYLSLYDTLWSFHVIYLIIYSFIYSFIEVVIHLCQHALILEIKVTKKWQITIHIVYATEYQLHNAALCSTSGNSDRKACQQQLAIFWMRRNRRMGWGKKKTNLIGRTGITDLCHRHPASRASFCLLDWGGEKEADLLESRHTFEVAAAKI